MVIFNSYVNLPEGKKQRNMGICPLEHAQLQTWEHMWPAKLSDRPAKIEYQVGRQEMIGRLGTQTFKNTPTLYIKHRESPKPG